LVDSVKSEKPNILLVNPWIHDFAAYDFWAKPIGLLSLGSWLRRRGYAVSYIDCLDRFHPFASSGKEPHRFGRGPYLKSPIPKPPGLEDVPRRYSRYGIPPEWFRTSLQSLPVPDLILVTSAMTYWYPGVQEAISEIREVFPGSPIVLGGTYATLCHRHASAKSGADAVVSGPWEDSIAGILERFTGGGDALENNGRLNPSLFPAFDLQSKMAYIPLQTSKGCPFACSYCASPILNPKRSLRDPDAVMEEIEYWHTDHQIDDFAFYDDALLMDADTHIIPLLRKIIQAGFDIRFHTPNALHIRWITHEISKLMFHSGFATLRIGLEMTDFRHRDNLDSKVTEREFIRAATYLRNAGFRKNQVGAYLLAGLPGQKTDALEGDIRLVKERGLTPILAYYSPVPHTAMWKDAVASSRYDLESDPIYTNNAIFPCQEDPFSWDTLSRLKSLITD